jgi:hypothetical protein
MLLAGLSLSCRCDTFQTWTIMEVHSMISGVTLKSYLTLGGVALALCANVRGATLTIFDAPDAGTAENLGTRAMSINNNGVIAGWYDNKVGIFGFVRASDGSITEFDAGGTRSTYAVAINDAGTITGYALNSGFVRASDGTITLFNSPAGANFPTLSLSINSAGTVTGYWIDSQQVAHGFLRTADGTFTSFDVPGAGTGAGFGTFAASINDAGGISGYFSNPLGSFGFIRSADGTFTKFFAGRYATYPLSINTAGELTGYWQDVNGLNHAFVRATDGTITTFGPNNSYTSSVSYSINATGTTTGYINGSGFIRTPAGTIYHFTGKNTGPICVSINGSNSVTGYYSFTTSTAFAWRGFVLTQ